MSQASPRLLTNASPRRLPPLPADQIERESAACLRPGLDRAIRSEFVEALQLGTTQLGPSLAKVTGTLGRYTSEQRENTLLLAEDEVMLLARERKLEALRLKARTRHSDIFHVEAQRARASEAAARAARLTQKAAAERQRKRERSRANLDVLLRRGMNAQLSPRSSLSSAFVP